MSEPTTITSKRSPIFGRTSIFAKVEDANKEVSERYKLLSALSKKSLYRVYEVPAPGGDIHYAVDLNPQGAIGQVAQAVGWIANVVSGGRCVKVTPATVAAQAANWSKEELAEAAKVLAKLSKSA